MDPDDALIGRDVERSQLEAALGDAARGAGSLILLSGEAGIGKTRLAEEVARQSEATVLRGAASHDAAVPYGPVVAALRSLLRARPSSLDRCGPLRPHLALLLPELGDGAPKSDPGTILEAVHSAFAAIAAEECVLVLLDDLHWSDEATLDLLAFLAEPLNEMSILALGCYRSDGLPRLHPLRRLRGELRRGGALREVSLGPLDADGTAELAERLLGAPAGETLRRTLHDRTQGIPFFVQEITAALATSGQLLEGAAGFELAGDDELPVPETVRDAVLLRTAWLSERGREAAEAAAVAGETFDLEAVAALASEGGLAELLDGGLVVEDETGRASFRHSLAREAIYHDVPWLRRRGLHCRLADNLEQAGAPAIEVAGHWQGAREDQRARGALLRAAEEFCALHAYRDAARAGRDALELWESGEDVGARLEALERYAGCAELAGELTEAARAWREVADIRLSHGAGRGPAEAQRHLAAIYALEGDRTRAVAARRAAADGFAAEGLAAEAAADRIIAAGYLQRIGAHSEADGLARAAADEARGAGRLDLVAEAQGLEGVARAKRGDLEAGLEMARAGLSLALEHGMTAQAGSLYQRLGTVLEAAGEYRDAENAMEAALGLCQTAGASDKERICLECLAYLQRELGEWDKCTELCLSLGRDGETGPGARVVVDGVLGSIEAFRGRASAGRELLTSALEAAVRIDLLSMQVDAAAGLAWVADAEGDHEAVARHCDFLLQRWSRSEDRHYAVWGLRWAAGYYSARGDERQARAFAEALARIAADGGHPYALAALADALGTTALAQGDAAVASEQLMRAVELHRGLEVPFEQAQICLHAGLALAAAGERELALERLADCHRIARGLGARPLAVRAGEEVAGLGESIGERLGKRAAAELEGGGLSRRELEVVRLVAIGRTNREIAEELVLSPRTVDMHVRNILTKFDCRSRVEAARRAAELGLLEADAARQQPA